MTHLTIDQLLDVAEGARPRETEEPGENTGAHLSSCADCRRQLAELRATIAAASEVEVPEPSPLFWNHLSARVREAIGDEGAPGSGGWGERWFSWRPWRLVAPAVVCLLVATVAVTFRPAASRSNGANIVTTGTDTVVDAVPASAIDDPSLNLMANLAADLEWDEAAEAGLVSGSGMVERAIADLTDEERIELQRLLKAALAESGA